MDLSSLLAYITTPLKNLFFYHKKKMAFFILSVLLFLVVLFPYSDLTSFSKDKINENIKASGSSVDYSKISLNLLPFGVQTNDLEFNTRTLKTPFRAGSVTLRPNLLSLLQLKAGGTAIISDLFSGNAELSASLNGKTEEKTQKFSVSADLDKISLGDILAFQGIAVKLKGFLSGELSAKGEDSFRTQPEGEFKFNLTNVVIPSSIPIPKMGDFPLPKKVLLENSNIFGNLSKGKINVTKGTLGTKKSPVNGRFRGSIDCVVAKLGKSMSPQCTNYDFKVELELDADFHNTITSQFKMLIKPNMVKITPLRQGGGATYTFAVKGDASSSFNPPVFRSLNSF